MNEEKMTIGMTVTSEAHATLTSISLNLKKPRVALVIPNDWVKRPIITLSEGPKPIPKSGRMTAKNGTNNNAPLTPSIFTRRAIKKATGKTQV